MNGGIALVGAILLAAPALHGQTGSVRIRVIDSKGVPVPGAAVSLADSWDRTVRTLSTNQGGEILWKKLPFGKWYFSVDFARLPVAVCDRHERTVTLRVAPPLTAADQVVVHGPSVPSVDIASMPICEALDRPKPSPHK